MYLRGTGQQSKQGVRSLQLLSDLELPALSRVTVGPHRIKTNVGLVWVRSRVTYRRAARLEYFSIFALVRHPEARLLEILGDCSGKSIQLLPLQAKHALRNNAFRALCS
jgi:hypothetical protein